MSNINNTDNVGGRTSHGDAGPIYPTNRKTPTEWGTHYDWDARERIVNDIANGVLGLEEMASMLDLGRSHIADWGRKFRPDFFGAPRRRIKRTNKGHNRGNGKEYSKDEKASIAQLITSGRYSVDQVAKQYQIWPTILRRWTTPGRSFRDNRKPAPIVPPVASKPAPTIVSTSKTDADGLLANPEHARLVINLLLNESPAKAQAVARALLVR